MKIPLLQGAYADSAAAFRSSYPINLEPTLVDSGIAKGYLVNAPGVRALAVGPGQDRGAINWNGICYRVMGSRLVSVSSAGTVRDHGEVSNDGKPVSMDYSFDRLAVASDQKLFYWNAAEGVTQVTDPDLGIVLDVLWIDGYFMTTDGESLVVTELNDPYSVDPLKYGSSEEDPDPVVALCKVRGEAYALNRYTIQNFQDIGGTGFPFTNNAGGLIPKGAVGTWAWAYFLETFAFVGSGRNEALSVYLAGAGQSICISTSEIDKELAALSVDQQATIQVEARVEEGEQRLYLHLPDKTLVYMRQASLQNDVPVWHQLNDGIVAAEAYGPRNMVQAYSQWVVGDAAGRIGALDTGIETRWGDTIGWQFDTIFVYNQAKGGIIQVLELVGLPGRVPFGATPTLSVCMTRDGETYDQERFIPQGTFGQRGKRIQWRPKKRFSNYMGIRFRGANTAMASWATLEATIEPLNV